MCCLEILQVAVPIRGCATAVNKQVGTTDKTTTGGHQELCQITHLVRRSGTTGRHTLDHPQVAILSWAMQFIVGQRRNDDTWGYRVDGGAPTAPACGFVHHTQHIAPLRVLLGFQRVVDILQEWQFQQFIHRSSGQSLVLFLWQSGKTMAALR